MLSSGKQRSAIEQNPSLYSVLIWGTEHDGQRDFAELLALGERGYARVKLHAIARRFACDDIAKGIQGAKVGWRYLRVEILYLGVFFQLIDASLGQAVGKLRAGFLRLDDLIAAGILFVLIIRGRCIGIRCDACLGFRRCGRVVRVSVAAIFGCPIAAAAGFRPIIFLDRLRDGLALGQAGFPYSLALLSFFVTTNNG